MKTTSSFKFWVVRSVQLHWTASSPRTTGVHLNTRAGSLSLTLSDSLLLSLTLSHSLLLSLILSHSLPLLSHSLRDTAVGEKQNLKILCWSPENFSGISGEILRNFLRKILEKFSGNTLNYVYYSVPQKNLKIGDQTLRISQEFQGINIFY